ncbi:MAG: energy transducer TonB [Chryseobacterium sp.]|nr:MAG: energy transducer TonB [Chryseobacterium sp.]
MKGIAEGVYATADVMPEYPGGKQAIQKFIDDNTEYPQNAMDDDIEGTVRVSFAIDEAGNVTKAKVTGVKAGHGLDEEALRVVKKMGKWKPGKINGKNVKVRLSLPVTFLIS